VAEGADGHDALVTGEVLRLAKAAGNVGIEAGARSLH
jgi:hypothetical protein